MSEQEQKTATVSDEEPLTIRAVSCTFCAKLMPQESAYLIISGTFQHHILAYDPMYHDYRPKPGGLVMRKQVFCNTECLAAELDKVFFS
jgi:hypothetical protein